MASASMEAMLEFWASSLRDVKARIRPSFTQERVAASASLFLDGLLGPEQAIQNARRRDQSQAYARLHWVMHRGALAQLPAHAQPLDSRGA